VTGEIAGRRRGGRRQPSMADVAARAGVSPITVSRVANGSPAVLEETRERVLAAMAELGYRPNKAARALKTGRFGTLGILTVNLSTYGNTRMIAALARAAEHVGYSVTHLAASPGPDDVQGAYQRLMEQAVDGLVVLADHEHLEARGFALPEGLPIVYASGGHPLYPAVDSDQVGGARQATGYLLSLGHSNVWHVAGPATYFSANARLEGWRATLLEAGIRPPEVLVGDWTSHTGYVLGKQLAADPEVTAIFVANDQMALGVMRALHEAERQIPGDVSVVGFDDAEDSAEFWPPLTTIHQEFDHSGAICVDLLLRAIRGEPVSPTQITVPTRLVIHESTGPPRKIH
jgi:DNA-binding LacI/PurR family transcriptional regulator